MATGDSSAWQESRACPEHRRATPPGSPVSERVSLAMGIASSSSLTGRTVGRFVIGERLGKGGMGEVYRAEDTRLKRAVALKRLPPYLRSDSVYRSRFQEEAERASRFTDPHVAAIYDVMDEQDETLLVMEYVEGQTLRRRLRDPMSLDEFLKIAVECAEALVAADHVGIVHCDIKPENIMLSTAGNVKILDFGVAKFLPRSDQSSTVDRSATIGGTPAYMSPEVLLEKGADGRSDIFSLGIVLYEVLAGHHPFLSDSYVATTHRILHEKAASIRIFNATVPEELNQIVARMMAKDPTKRYANAQELVEDLRAVQARITPNKPLPRPLIRHQGHPRARILAVAAVALLLAGGYVFYSWKHRPPPFQERGWALITDFDSTGEDPIPAKGVREGLTIALQQSPYVNVYPRTRIYEALERMKRTDVSRIDEILGREICRRENIQVLLTGSIEHVGQAFQVSVRGESPATGNLLFAENKHFDKKEQFFDEVDKLARDVRRDLGESVGKISNTSKPLANVTTNSLDALQLYSEASDLIAQGKLDPAPSLLEGALQLDSNFAMAHLVLGNLSGSIGNREEETKHLQIAYDLRQGVSDRERRLIESAYYSAKGHYEKQVESLRILVALYPDDPQVHQDLALAYRNIGDVPRAIEQLKEVLRLDPFSAPGHLHMILFLARNNQSDEALKAYDDAVRLGVDAPGIHWAVGLAKFDKGAVAEARQEFLRVQQAGGYQSVGRLYVARTYIYEGKFDLATQQLTANTLADRTSGNTYPELVDHYLLASIYGITNKRDSMRRELGLILKTGDGRSAQAGDLVRVGVLYARMGDLNAARTVLRRLDVLRSAESTAFDEACFHIVSGEISMVEGQLDMAGKVLTKANEEYPMVPSHESMARLQELRGDWPGAIAEWKGVLNSSGEIFQDHSPSDWVLAHLAAARAYAKIKDYASAESYYRQFLRLWDKSDSVASKDEAFRELQAIEGGKTQAQLVD